MLIFTQSPAHVYYSGYTWAQLKPLVTMIMECCENPQKHHSAVFEKYSDRRYKRASVFVRGEMEKDFTLPSTQPQMSRQSLPVFEDFTDHMSFETRESFKRMVQVKG
jgi:G2/mitotic-specific cyclin 3/4